jgi:hypothetical protein
MKGIRCNQCGDELFLDSPHDVKSCKCRKCLIDGCGDCLRMVGDYTEMEKDDRHKDV